MADSKLDAAIEKLAENKAAALAGALGIALGLVTSVAFRRDDTTEQRDAKIEAAKAELDASARLPAGDVPVDVAEYHLAIRKVRDEDSTLVDLLSAPVAPGDDVETGVTLPDGAAITNVEIVGPAMKSFELLGTFCTDARGHRCGVRARNVGDGPQRLTALVHFEVTSP